jgi:ubiquinol-cytochrome c reductase cytochrome b subunit
MQRHVMRKIMDWIDQRTGIRALMRYLLNEPIPGGASWAYVFGSGLVCAIFIQVVTGIALALYYVPAALSAHATVAYITKQVWSGSFIRSVHAYGTHVIVVLVFAHLLQTFLYGAFKRRREILWLSGVCLLLLLLGMAFTGSLLPWDQRAFFASAVGTSVMGEVPVVGPAMKRMMRGGDQMGTLTLSRFYVLHVIILPLGIVTLIALHVFLFRKAGPAGPPESEFKNVVPASQPFYPRQFAMDAAFAAIILAVLAGLAHFLPVTLGPEADPSNTQYLPRPEWYFLPLFQWLKYWKAPYTVVGVVVIPTLVLLLFIGVPFLDRSAERHPSKRPFLVVGFLATLTGLAILGVLSRRDDRIDSVVHAQLIRQEEDVARYMRQRFVPISPVRLESAPSSPEIAAGQRVFLAHHCNFCHGDGAVGTAAAPSLGDIGQQFSDDQLKALIRQPNAKMLAGRMPAFVGSDEDLQALVEYLKSLQ